MLLRRAMVVAGVLIALPGCSEASTSTSPEAVIRAYVEALDAGDFTTAMSMRCPSSQIDNSLRDQFLAEVERLKKAAGGRLQVASVDEVQPVRLGDAAGTPVEREFRVRLNGETPAGNGAVIGTVSDGGHAMVCESTLEEAFAVQSRINSLQVEPVSATVNNVEAVASGAAAALGVDVFSQRASSGFDQQGLEGWSTAWKSAEYGGGRITAVRYESAAEAAQHAVDVLSHFGPDASVLFDVPGVPSAVGLRYRGSAWTAVQPADLGPQIDTAVVVYGDVLVWISVNGLQPADDHAAVAEVAAAVASVVTSA